MTKGESHFSHFRSLHHVDLDIKLSLVDVPFSDLKKMRT